METLDIRNIKPLSEFRNNLKKYIQELNSTKKPMVITQHGKSAAVVLNVDKFQQMQDQIDFMKKIVRGLEDYKKDEFHSKSEVFSEISKIINKSE